MAALYTDHNIDRRIAVELRQLGHYVVTAPTLGLERVGGDEHLLTAAQHRWILLTHDWQDFGLLHNAWRRWPPFWQVLPPLQHAGILVIPQSRIPADAALEVHRFLESGLPLANELYRYHAQRGWTQQS